MNNIVKDFYEPSLAKSEFILCPESDLFCTEGQCWKLNETHGGGHFWIYESVKHFNIKIHDFWFKKDDIVELHIPECLSTTYYESISGEELNPYKTLNCHVVKSFFGGYKPFNALIHKNIPIRSIGIEFQPEYYETYLKANYPQNYQSPQSAFGNIDDAKDFSELVYLLNQVKNYRGEGLSAHLFYEAKAAEALSFIFERQLKQNAIKKTPLSSKDSQMIACVSAYIDDHYADEITLERLTKIAYMGTTKLKTSFKTFHGCTITDYIQNRRMTQAEHFLSYTDLPMGQVAKAVGYSNAGRFAELFRKAKGLLPGEFRKMVHRDT